MQTLFIVTGVAIGVGVIVFMSALLAGLQTNFMRRVLNAQAHIQLLQPQQTTRLLRGAGSADRLALEESRAYLLTADLDEIQARVIAAHGVSQADLDTAFAYYNSGAGRDRKIIDAAAAVRKNLGKHLCVVARTARQCNFAADMAEGALRVTRDSR